MKKPQIGVIGLGGKSAFLACDHVPMVRRWIPPAQGIPLTVFLTAALAVRKSLTDAAKIVAVAAGICVTRHGAAGSIPTKAEVEEYEKI